MAGERKFMSFVAGAAAGVAAAAAWLIPGSRATPAEKERKRRLAVSAKGRLGSAMITDFHDGIVSYRYTIRGVVYSATQDVSAIADLLPKNLEMLIERPAGLKYLTRNPANSIVLCEDWSGLRFRERPRPSHQGSGQRQG